MRKKEDTICGHVPTVAGITACLFMTVSWTACFVLEPDCGRFAESVSDHDDLSEWDATDF